MTKTKMAVAYLAALVAVANAQQVQDARPQTWTDSLTLKGDVRGRLELIDEDGKDSRERMRMRARLAAEAKVATEWTAGIGLATSENNDPVSSNVTLDSAGSRKNVYLDLAWLRWGPAGTGYGVTAGKMKQPMYTVRDLVFDNDLNPEGIVFQHGNKEEAYETFLNAGGFAIDEVSDGDDVYMYAAQAGLKLNVGEASSFTIGASDYMYDDLEGHPAIDHATTDPTKVSAKGNQTTKTTKVGADGKDVVTGVFYKYGFNVVEGFLVFDTKAGELPLQAYAEYAVNTEADDEDTAYLAGLRLGKAKDPGSWELDYNYRELEANAVFGANTDSDFAGGGTDGKGHRFGGSYQIAKNVKGTVAYFLNERAVTKGGTDYDRLQIDCTVSF